MPNPSHFLRGFDIKKGMKIAGYVLTQVNIGHEEIERFRQYKYPIKLTFTLDNPNGPDDPQLLLRYLKTKVSKTKVIDSAYGNPYESHFGTLKIQNKDKQKVVITSEGYAKRIFH